MRKVKNPGEKSSWAWLGEVWTWRSLEFLWGNFCFSLVFVGCCDVKASHPVSRKPRGKFVPGSSFPCHGIEEFGLFQLREWCCGCSEELQEGICSWGLSKNPFPSSSFPNLAKSTGNSDLWVGYWINEQGKGKEAEIHGILPCTPRKPELPAGILGSQFLPAAELGGCSEPPGASFNASAVLGVAEVILDFGVLLPQLVLQWQSPGIFLAPEPVCHASCWQRWDLRGGVSGKAMQPFSELEKCHLDTFYC